MVPMNPFKWSYRSNRVLLLTFVQFNFYGMPLHQLVWYWQGFGLLWQAFVVVLMLMNQKGLKVPHNK